MTPNHLELNGADTSTTAEFEVTEYDEGTMYLLIGAGGGEDDWGTVRVSLADAARLRDWLIAALS